MSLGILRLFLPVGCILPNNVVLKSTCSFQYLSNGSGVSLVRQFLEGFAARMHVQTGDRVSGVLLVS